VDWATSSVTVRLMPTERERGAYTFSLGEMAQVLATNVLGIKRESRMQPRESVAEGRNSKVCKTLKV